MPERKFSILFLDSGQNTRYLPEIPDVDIQPVLGTCGPYECTVEETVFIMKQTSGGLVDYVVIGNNMGKGVPKAEAVAEPMRKKACIVWNSKPSSIDEAPYKTLGFENFMSRFELTDHLEGYIKKLLK